MRNSVVIFCAVTLAVVALVQAAPAPPSRSPNPTVNLLHQGLIDKLCKRDMANGSGTQASSSTSTSTSTTTTSTTGRPTPKARSSFRRQRQAPAGPSCSKYNNYTFAQLIEENKKLLRPVPNRPY